MLLLQKDLRELSRDRGFLIFVFVWCFVAFISQFTPTSSLDGKYTKQTVSTPAETPNQSSNTPERPKSGLISLFGPEEVAKPKDSSPVKIAIQGNSDTIRAMLANDASIQIKSIDNLDAKEAINKGLVEAVVSIPPGLERVKDIQEKDDGWPKHKTPHVIILSKDWPPGDRSQSVSTAVDNIRQKIVQENLEKVKLKGSWWQKDLEKEEIEVGGTQAFGILDASRAIPFLMTFAISLVTTVYSIELVCSENVRGTLALLIAAPINRISILAAKTFLVSVTAFGSLASAITMAKRSLNAAKTGSSIDANTGVLMLALPLVFVIASWSVFMALRYRTRGTAMARLIPGAVIALTLAGISVLPGVHSGFDLSLVPIANITSSVRDFLSGQFDLRLTAVAVSSCLLYGFLCMKQAASMLDDYGDAGSRSPSAIPMPGSGFQLAVGLFVVTLVANFYISRQLIICAALPGNFMSVAVSVFLATGAMFVTRRFRILELFKIRKEKPRFIGEVVIALGVLTAIVAFSTRTLQAINPFAVLATSPTDAMFIWSIFASTILAVAQEVLFRGVFQTLLTSTFNRFTLPLAIGVISGLCQPDTNSFFVASLFGIVLSILVTWRNSIYPSIALHVILNLVALYCSIGLNAKID